MTIHYVDNSDGRTFWQASHVYSVGDRCCCPASSTDGWHRHRVYECTTGGTSGSSAPSWNYTIGGTCNDNGVIWTTRDPHSWTDAHPSFILMMGDDMIAAADIIYVHDAHNEVCPSTDGAEYFITDTLSLVSSPLFIVCVDKNDSNALSSGAVIHAQRSLKRVHGNQAVVFINMQFKFDGNFFCDDLGTYIFVCIGEPLTVMTLNGTSSIIDFGVGWNYNQRMILINSNLKFSYATNYMEMNSWCFEWYGGKLIAPNGVNFVWATYQYGGDRVICDGVDLSEVGANELFSVVSSAGGAYTQHRLTRCKLANSPPGILHDSYSSVRHHQGKMKLHHCSSLNRTWEFYEVGMEGTVSSESAITRQGGAVDGGQKISWKAVSLTNIHELSAPPLGFPTINFWTYTETQITVTIHGLIDSATNLQDDEVYMEISYPADMTSGLGAFKTTQKLKGIEATSDLSTSTETWNGTGGMGNPNKFKLTATFTPAKAGPIKIQVYLAKPSTTIYVCPRVVVS